MKIYYQYSKIKKFAPIKGDFINEFNTLLALSRFSNVFYSGNQFSNKKNIGYGMKDYPQTISTKCAEDKYDAYIVRANAKLFRTIKSGNKFWVASPYIEDCFEEARAIITFTKAWEMALRRGKKCPLNPDGRVFKNVLTIHQTINPRFKPMQRKEKTRKIRQSFHGEFIIGYFGKIKTGDRVSSFMRVVDRVKETHPGARLVLSSTNRVIDNESAINARFNYFDVPYAISACDMTICDGMSPLGGKLKILESMACGVPVISPRFRQEQLGKKYPFLYNREPDPDNRYILSAKSEDQIYNMIMRAIDDRRFLKNTGRQLLSQSKFYSIEESAKRLERDLERLIK